MDFHSLTRRELQALCKKNRIPANMTNVAMADALKALEVVEAIEEIQPAVENANPQCPAKTPARSALQTPEVSRACRRSARRNPVVASETESKVDQESPLYAARSRARTAARASASRRKILRDDEETEPEEEKEMKESAEGNTDMVLKTPGIGNGPRTRATTTAPVRGKATTQKTPAAVHSSLRTTTRRSTRLMASEKKLFEELPSTRKTRGRKEAVKIAESEISENTSEGMSEVTNAPAQKTKGPTGDGEKGSDIVGRDAEELSIEVSAITKESSELPQKDSIGLDNYESASESEGEVEITSADATAAPMSQDRVHMDAGKFSGEVKGASQEAAQESATLLEDEFLLDEAEKCVPMIMNETSNDDARTGEEENGEVDSTPVPEDADAGKFSCKAITACQDSGTKFSTLLEHGLLLDDGEACVPTIVNAIPNDDVETGREESGEGDSSPIPEETLLENEATQEKPAEESSPLGSMERVSTGEPDLELQMEHSSDDSDENENYPEKPQLKLEDGNTLFALNSIDAANPLSDEGSEAGEKSLESQDEDADEDEQELRLVSSPLKETEIAEHESLVGMQERASENLFSGEIPVEVLSESGESLEIEPLMAAEEMAERDEEHTHENLPAEKELACGNVSEIFTETHSGTVEYSVYKKFVRDLAEALTPLRVSTSGEIYSDFPMKSPSKAAITPKSCSSLRRLSAKKATPIKSNGKKKVLETDNKENNSEHSINREIVKIEKLELEGKSLRQLKRMVKEKTKENNMTTEVDRKFTALQPLNENLPLTARNN